MKYGTSSSDRYPGQRGHLSSNLGIVEISLAVHRMFDPPQDKLIWDVGHQTYVHKILTGRMDRFPTLRKFKGMSGFPKTAESEYDLFDTGHSSTSISLGLGMAAARDLKERRLPCRICNRRRRDDRWYGL